MVSFPKRTLQKLALLSTTTITPSPSTVAAMTSSSFSSKAGTTSANEQCSSTSVSTALEQARQLVLPTYEEMLRRDSKVYDFWNHNEGLLVDAWKEWNENDPQALALPKLSAATLINPKLRQTVEAAWKNPTKENEQAIKDLWEEVAPGVFAIQFFNLEEVYKLRQWFDTTATAGIPVRPPYGIVLNRKGVMIDERSVGYLAPPDFQEFYKMLVNEYIRPLGRLFFPEHIRETDDSESFAFSIQYQGEQGGDKSIRHHTDASTVTFNLNLDDTKTWTGSSLIFLDQNTGTTHDVEWAPGIAVMHLGKSMHAALPIETGTRSNWVIWTFAKNGGRGYGSNPSVLTGNDGTYPEEYRLTPKERWTRPEVGDNVYWDRWSPF